MKHRFALLLFFLLTAWPSHGQKADLLEPYQAVSEKKWAGDMAAFAKKDAKEDHPDDAILFVGSSSIRLWKTLSEDAKPYHAIQRGFGGSKWSDVAVHTDQLIKPHKFRAVVFFVANDIKGKAGNSGEIDKTPGEVLELVQYVAAQVHAHNPEAELFFLPTTPCTNRWEAWPTIKDANDRIKEWCEGHPKAHQIPTAELFLDEKGKPKDELFQDDLLHLKPEGYELWTKAVIKALDSVLAKSSAINSQ